MISRRRFLTGALATTANVLAFHAARGAIDKIDPRDAPGISNKWTGNPAYADNDTAALQWAVDQNNAGNGGVMLPTKVGYISSPINLGSVAGSAGISIEGVGASWGQPGNSYLVVVTNMGIPLDGVGGKALRLSRFTLGALPGVTVTVPWLISPSQAVGGVDMVLLDEVYASLPSDYGFLFIGVGSSAMRHCQLYNTLLGDRPTLTFASINRYNLASSFNGAPVLGQCSDFDVVKCETHRRFGSRWASAILLDHDVRGMAFWLGNMSHADSSVAPLSYIQSAGNFEQADIEIFKRPYVDSGPLPDHLWYTQGSVPPRNIGVHPRLTLSSSITGSVFGGVQPIP